MTAVVQNCNCDSLSVDEASDFGHHSYTYVWRG